MLSQPILERVCEPFSVIVQDKAISLVYQPSFPIVPTELDTITGGVVSQIETNGTPVGAMPVKGSHTTKVPLIVYDSLVSHRPVFLEPTPIFELARVRQCRTGGMKSNVELALMQDVCVPVDLQQTWPLNIVSPFN